MNFFYSFTVVASDLLKLGETCVILRLSKYHQQISFYSKALSLKPSLNQITLPTSLKSTDFFNLFRIESLI